MIHTLTSREFGHNASSAKNLAREGLVFITDRGAPAFVLMHIDEYRKLTVGERELSLLEAMDGLPNSAEAADFDIEPIVLQLRAEG
ncbi:MAG: type II toxin-antitoxin system Phd/YefM family antitoxin [Pseudomonadales bacterium]|nr:type II toxin-antitoxin system Phd/YefM family antitoxin [Pseudomonadales bacterium]